MNEYDDLFKQFDNPTPQNQPLGYDPNQEFFEIEREARINRILVFVYVIVSVLVSAFTLMWTDYRFSDSDSLIANILIVVPFEMEVSPDPDTEGQYIIHMTGSVQNLNDEELPSISILFSFSYADSDVLDTYTLSKDYVASQEVWNIDETLYGDASPVSFTLQRGVDESGAFYSYINFFNMFIVAVAFLLIDKRNFSKQAKEFKGRLGYYIGQIVVGYIFVYVALVASQYIMNLLGVTGGSQNESAIQSMFSDDPYQLAILFLMLCVFTPIVEELVFRKAAFGLIEKRWGPIAAIFISGSIFGLMHVVFYGDFIQSLPYIAMGLTFGYIYYRAKKNIYVTIGVHFINNLVAFIGYLLLLFYYV